MNGAPTRTTLVGREREVARIQAGIARVAGGEPGILILTGLPGAGSSRLAREALDRAADAGFETFVGHCDEWGVDVAYAPFVEAFGPYLHRSGGGSTEYLLADLPQLGLVFGGPQPPGPRPLSDPALDRARLLDGFTRLVERVARTAPVALMIDDAQAADAESVLLLRHLALTVSGPDRGDRADGWNGAGPVGAADDFAGGN